MALINATTGELAAEYAYGPFGELIRATGPLAKENPFRFSTKYQDDETDWVYFGYRYYSPSLGRWSNGDPIGELGGINLHAFVRNAPVIYFDCNGLEIRFPPGAPDSFVRHWGQVIDVLRQTQRGRDLLARAESPGGIVNL